MLNTGRYAGGGCHIRAERMSLGIFFSVMTFAPRMLFSRAWVGLFWLTRETYDAVGGFNEEWVSAEDLDFARRVRAWGRSRGLCYGLIHKAFSLWQTASLRPERKFYLSPKTSMPG